MSFQRYNYVQPCGPGRVSIPFGMSKGMGGQIARAVQKQLNLPSGSKRRRQTRYCLELILFNAWRCHQVQQALQDQVVVKYSRKKADYGQLGRYGKGQLSFKVMMPALDTLEAAGYISQLKTKPGYFLRRSMFWPTPKLANFFTAPTAQAPKIIEHDKEVIRLVDSNKKEMDYTDDANTNNMRLAVRKLNACNRDHSFTLTLPGTLIGGAYSSTPSTSGARVSGSQDVSCAIISNKNYVFKNLQQTNHLIYSGASISTTPVLWNTQGHSSNSTSTTGAPTSTCTSCGGSRDKTAFVFHDVPATFDLGTLSLSIPLDGLMPYTRNFSRGRFDRGGRFYCDAQNIPKSFRPHILIDGGPTVELDYLANHVFMLYADLGVQLLSDPYLGVIFPGLPNTPLPRKVVKRAILRMLNTKSRAGTIKSLKKAVRKGKLVLPPNSTEDDLVKAIELHHAPLLPHFNTDKGVELQYRDSKVAALVFNSFVGARKPIFGLHDGFRVRAEDEDFLRLAMFDAFKAEVGVNPIVEP
jgi:hypothetical protein